ncbi:MAG: T9SS type A sorting domain-containing protein [Gemmatimonadetes bacterium]|nr:T9SS type A sorting domain-containing protein [Gemmatimonadota bacterium]
MSIRNRLLGALAVVCLLSPPAWAFVDPQHPVDGAVRLPLELVVEPTAPLDAAQLAKASAWTGFKARHGQWEILWNGWTGTPHHALGRGIQVSGPVTNSFDAGRIAEEFLRSETALTKAGEVDLELAAALKGGRIWYANFRQMHQGVEVLNTDMTVRLDESGRVTMFGSEARTDIDLDMRPLLSADTARLRAREGLTFDVNTDETKGGEDLYILPIEHAAGVDYHLVRHVRVSQSSPAHEWETFVDAHDGEIKWRFDRVRHGSVSGHCDIDVKEFSPLDAQVTRSSAHQRVTVGSEVTNSDPNGDYAVGFVSGTETVTMRLEGPWVNVDRFTGADAEYTINVNTDTNPTVDHQWDNATSHFSERMGFYHTNQAHDWIKDIDPNFTDIDYSMPCVVLDTGDECNAFWNGVGITFFAASATCRSIANLPDVVYHEYGHGINDKLYEQAGSPFGLTNGALHEGLADVVATLMQDDPELGQGFFLSTNTGIRNVDNTNTFPFDVAGQVHNDGLIIGGAFWDLRLLVGNATAADLHHFARYGLPQHANLRLAYQEYFIETLVADDDNGDLGDQTPNWASILDAFNQHGIGPSLFLTFAHTGLDDTAATGSPILASATVSSSNALFPVDASSVQLTYSVDGGVDASVPMTDSGSSYDGTIPGQSEGTLISYFLEASATGGAPIFAPSEPNSVRHSFLVGTQTQALLYEMEATSGWSVNDGTDNATTGIWERGDPHQVILNGTTILMTGNDHTPSGTDCWVTGNLPGAVDGQDDVDGGKTTLLSPIFDATGMFRPAIRYYRWYTNNLGGDPGSDVWRVDISNDGGSTWSPVENTTGSSTAWTKIIFQIENVTTPTNNMRMRFIAEDAGGGSLVEAAVDDWELIEFEAATGIGDDPTLPSIYALAQNQPNPFNPVTEIRFALPASGPTRLNVYDLAGRRVATLVDEVRTAGRHTVSWNGTDAAGVAVASGVYVYKLESGDFQQTKRMVLVK